MAESRNTLTAGYKLHWYMIKDVLGQGGFGITYLEFNKRVREAIREGNLPLAEAYIKEGLKLAPDNKRLARALENIRENIQENDLEDD